MNKPNLYLVIALFAQLGLGAVTWTTCESTTEKPSPKALLGIESSEIDEIEITAPPPASGKDPDRIVLTRNGGKWEATSAADFPVEKSKVTDVLDKLTALTAADPIAAKAASHNALGVGETQYGKKITIRTKSGSRTFFIGDGPGESVHLRFDKKDEVFRARGLSEWKVKSKVSDYIDSTYVKVDEETLTHVEVKRAEGTLTFSKQGETWTLAELPEGRELDEIKVDTFLAKVGDVALKTPVGKTIKPEYGLEQGVSVTLTYTKDDKAHHLEYTIGAEEGDNAFYLKSNDSEFVVTVSKWSVEQIRDKGPEDFAKRVEDTEPAAEEAMTGSIR